MSETLKYVPQPTFHTIGDFMEGSNNFYCHFVGDYGFGPAVYRKQPHFVRYQSQFPDEEVATTEATTNAVRSGEFPVPLPWNLLFVAYQHMSQLVLPTDPFVNERLLVM